MDGRRDENKYRACIDRNGASDGRDLKPLQRDRWEGSMINITDREGNENKRREEGTYFTLTVKIE